MSSYNVEKVLKKHHWKSLFFSVKLQVEKFCVFSEDFTKTVSYFQGADCIVYY